MASWQAHISSPILRLLIKPRFARAKNVVQLRAHVIAAFQGAGGRENHASDRLAPENHFPAAIDDAVACYRAILLAGTREETVVTAGDSAGGGLLLSTLVALRDSANPLPSGCAILTLDRPGSHRRSYALRRTRRAILRATYRALAAAVPDDRDPKDPLASPLYADLSALPPLMIHVGEDEVLLDDSVWLAAHARAAGNDATLRIWPIVPHGWQLAPTIPEARQSLSEACDFLFSCIENRQTKHAHSRWPRFETSSVRESLKS